MLQSGNLHLSTMNEASSKSGLLTLPIEVREHILSYCLQDTWDAPES